MDVYLMQHGEAAAEADDPARPLTEGGRAAVTRVAAKAQTAGVQIDRLLHSGKLRAEQTAQILEARDGLAPDGATNPIARWLGGQSDDGSVAIIGHLPFLDRLASSLVAGDEEAHVISFQNAGLIKLVQNAERGGFSVAWVLVPEIA
jgi:phosphohistidine phosphatase